MILIARSPKLIFEKNWNFDLARPFSPLLRSTNNQKYFTNFSLGNAITFSYHLITLPLIIMIFPKYSVDGERRKRDVARRLPTRRKAQILGFSDGSSGLFKVVFRWVFRQNVWRSAGTTAVAMIIDLLIYFWKFFFSGLFFSCSWIILAVCFVDFLFFSDLLIFSGFLSLSLNFLILGLDTKMEIYTKNYRIFTRHRQDLFNGLILEKKNFFLQFLKILVFFSLQIPCQSSIFQNFRKNVFLLILSILLIFSHKNLEFLAISTGSFYYALSIFSSIIYCILHRNRLFSCYCEKYWFFFQKKINIFLLILLINPLINPLITPPLSIDWLLITNPVVSIQAKHVVERSRDSWEVSEEENSYWHWDHSRLAKESAKTSSGLQKTSFRIVNSFSRPNPPLIIVLLLVCVFLPFSFPSPLIFWWPADYR